MEAIKDTYNRCTEWQNNIRYWTDLVMTLNHKAWYWYKKNNKISELYTNLFQLADELVFTNDKFTKDEVQYYLRITD
jgi:hypothetical protein